MKYFLMLILAIEIGLISRNWNPYPECILTSVSQHHEWVFINHSINESLLLSETKEYRPYYAQHFTCKDEIKKVVMPL